MTKKISIKIAALGLCAIMFGGAGIAMLDFGKTDSANAKATADMEDVTGKYDLNSVKEGLYNKGVEENFVNRTGKGNVIVKLGGADVYDCFQDTFYINNEKEFSGYVNSASGVRQTENLLKQHNEVLARMRAAGIAYDFKYSYTALSNAFSVTVDYSDVTEIEKIAGVEAVYYSNTFSAPEIAVTTNNANVYETGIYNSENIEYKGEGMVVAVLDTGLDYTHEAFQTIPDSPAWDEDYVASRFGGTLAKTSRMTSAEASDVYVNGKVPYAFDYADNDCNVYPSYSTHGTHVAGIIAGQDDNKQFGDRTFIGVAPQAQLAIMKVFTDNLDSSMLGGADTADILAAINDCAVLGVDVINMSLGSSGGFSSEETDEFLTEVYSKVEEMGISLIVAAGNEYSSGYGGGNGVNLATNPDSGTVGSPSTYYPALSVASINGQESPYFIANKAADGGSVAFTTNAVDTYSNEIKFTEKLFERFAGSVAEDGSLTLDYIVINGVGRSGNYTSAIKREFKNKNAIALVKRGDISFSEKVQNATEAGAVGVIVYNNLSGDITMSLADLEDPIPTCSINLNAGTAMVNGATSSKGVNKGTVTIHPSYKAGPFMSAFSGWGVTPDLKLKPEISAHGGEITSAVPGGYDTYSGTSMAAPNMAGAVALLRQHVKKTTGLTGQDLNARINQLLMSTATIALNPDGNPYSPRKQGAGLGNIDSAINTEAYIRIEKDGGYSDKTKIEFGDDVQKTGVYTAQFTVTNTADNDLSYKLSSYVFTETLAINKKTVEENAYMLKDDKTSLADVTYKIGGVTYSGGDEITVPANGDVKVSVTVKLGAEAKKYIEESFKNGMYVEGYFRLLKTENGAYTDLSVPFLAFYGDWSKAPLLDYSIYELAVTDADTSIEEEDKPVASARATTPLGLYYDGKYIMPLGTYLYKQSEDEVEIFPDSSKAAISMYDDVNRRTVYQLYMIYGGLLRGAKTLHMTITDAVTGETVYDQTEYNVRKSYALGGNNVGSPIMVEMNPYEWGLANNREYIFRMQGTIDWDKNGGKVDNDTFEFTFHVDYEAPSIESYTVRYEPYTDNKETKYRIFLDVNVYDNQYVQSLLPCYVKDNTLYLMTEYAIPVYSQQNSITKVSFEITDFYDDYGDEIYLGVEDYAMNQSLYHLNLKKATRYSDSIELGQEDGKLVKTGTRKTTTVVNGEQVVNEYGTYKLNLSPNEAYKLNPTVEPEDTYAYKLDWSSSANSVAIAYENEIFAKKNGTAIISVKDGNGLTKAQVTVTVNGTPLEAPAPEKLSFRPIINKDNYIQNISTDSSTGTTTVDLYPNTSFQLKVDVEPWYVTDIEFEWSSSNENVLTVDENGNVTTKLKGVAYITVQAKGYSRVLKKLRVNVVSGFYILNYTLYGYHGPNDVVIPDELNIMYLDEDTFKDNRNITSLVLPKTLTEIPENAFKNCTALKTVEIPSETTVVGKSAFEGCVALETIKLRKFIDDDTKEEMTGALTVANRGFANCESLKTIINPLRLTTVGREAFSGCKSLVNLNVEGVAVAYDNAFENCTSLKSIAFSEFTHPASGMFKGCTALETVTYPMGAVADGMFENCTSLSTVNFTSKLSSIGNNAFANTAISSLTIGSGAVKFGDYAFKDCKNLQAVTLGAGVKVNFAGINPFGGCDNFVEFTLSGNTEYSVDGGILYNAGKTRVVLVPEGVTDITLPSTVTEIGSNLFAGRRSLTSVDLSNVSYIGDYAFAETGLKSVTLPAGLQYLGKGAFSGCTALSQVTFEASALDVIADETFAKCASLKQITLPAGITHIGKGAFENSALQSVTFGGAEEVIASRAFFGTRIGSVTLPSTVSEIGAYAFASNPSLNVANLSAIKEMGARAFHNCPMLHTVTFADGTEVIGEEAFAVLSDGETTSLKTVTLPDSVKTIGFGAFFMCDRLASVNLAHVKSIGDYAFFGTAIQTVSTSAETVGDFAFAASEVKNATLTGTRIIGAKAFYGSQLSVLNTDAAEVIGENAFSKTKLTSVSLPATLSNYSYQKTIKIYSNSKERFEDKTVSAESFGTGALADISTLENITVGGTDGDFFTDNGVLYAKVANGYALVQYPANHSGEEYVVLDGTVRIEAQAFANVKNLKKIVFSPELKSVGSLAFYNSSVEDYTFRSVAAPVLDSTYVDISTLNEKDILYTIFSTESNLELGSQVYYANFSNYVALITEEKNLNESGHRYTAPSFGLTVTYPENGTGYDNLIWKSFFETHKNSAYAAEELTLRTIAAIAGLPSASEINAASSISELDSGVAAKVSAARGYYNLVNDAKQLEFITGYDKLIEAEKTVRQARERLGSPATVVSLKIVSRPDKLRYYTGETFDPAGMRIVAVYSDTSEEEVTGYTLDKTTLTADDSRVYVSYGGVAQHVNISVNDRLTFVITYVGEGFEQFTRNVTEGAKAEQPAAPVRKGYDFDGWYLGEEKFDFGKEITSDLTLTARWTEKNGLGGGAIAGIVISCVAACGAAAAATLVLLKRKKNKTAAEG